ncbi:MAG: glycosyl transferase [Ruminococcaceae bacterium]|nr:glycosyl transferase [Oscillospiraceae bacterium]
MYVNVKSREKQNIPIHVIERAFKDKLCGFTDSEFLTYDGKKAIAATGLPYYMPVCLYALNQPVFEDYLWDNNNTSHLFVFEGEHITHYTEDGEVKVPAEVEEALLCMYRRLDISAGDIDEDGAHVIDLKAVPVGPHFDVNLLLGNRVGFENPLLTTPKSALDSLGRGSFRGKAENQVLATRYVWRMEENGEPVNRQFYLYEGGKQIFYSANVNENVKTAVCRHLQNRTVITYETECGLKITRTIFIVPHEHDMPEAVEAQRVEIENLTDRDRDIRIVFTGMLSVFGPDGIFGDIVYANIVHESAVVKNEEGRAVCVSPRLHPRYGRYCRRFATVLANGDYFDEYCVNYSEFMGSGDIYHPENGGRLTSRQNRKDAAFFALSKTVTVRAGAVAIADSYAGICSHDDDVTDKFLRQAGNFIEKYRDPAALTAAYKSVVDFVESYSSYITFNSDDRRMSSYISKNLPFQVLYQSFVTRAFAWTNKGGRKVGFREIQDMYASMYYMTAMGNSGLARDMISRWAENVFEDGYAYHNFYWSGDGAGTGSDDQLWLMQAVYRYVMLTGDVDFVNKEVPIAGCEGKTRTIFDTMMAAVFYSGCISVGDHGLPLLDHLDWNDCLKLDYDSISAPEKMELYRRQIAEKGQKWGARFESHYCESVMNAFLLKIAYDNLAELADLSGRTEEAKWLREKCEKLCEDIQDHAWKGDFFARCLINNPEKGYTYLGAGGDGLSLNPDFPGSYWLNSFSWALLAGCATEEQMRIMLDSVNKYIRTPAGLTLTSPCDLDKVSETTAMDHYFRGDRENGAVFKHATMMATAAMFKACKVIKDEELAAEFAKTAFWMLDLVLPYQTLKTPYITKGNPRFCTQYNNSETGENIGPMLSGTASWLSLTVYEFLGISHVDGGIDLKPVLPFDTLHANYVVRVDGTEFDITVEKSAGFARPTENTEYTFDGEKCTSIIPNPRDGKKHTVTVKM